MDWIWWAVSVLCGLPSFFPSKPWHVLNQSLLFLFIFFFLLPSLFSWQLRAPTVSSHTAYHLLHFTDCGCSKAKFTAQPHKPHKPTLLFESFAFRSSSLSFCLFIFAYFLFFWWGGSKELWVFRIVTEYAMKWCWLSSRSGAVAVERLTMSRVLSVIATFVFEYLRAHWRTIIHALARARAHTHARTHFDVW